MRPVLCGPDRVGWQENVELWDNSPTAGAGRYNNYIGVKKGQQENKPKLLYSPIGERFAAASTDRPAGWAGVLVRFVARCTSSPHRPLLVVYVINVIFAIGLARERHRTVRAAVQPLVRVLAQVAAKGRLGECFPAQRAGDFGGRGGRFSSGPIRPRRGMGRLCFVIQL